MQQHIFTKLIQIGILFRLPDGFQHQFDDVSGDAVSDDICKQVFIQQSSAVFFDPVKVFVLAVIYLKIQDGGGLQHGCLRRLLLLSDTIDHVRLQAKHLCQDGHHQTGFAVLHGAYDNASGLVRQWVSLDCKNRIYGRMTAKALPAFINKRSLQA